MAEELLIPVTPVLVGIFAVLSVIVLAGITYALSYGAKILKSTFSRLLLASILINVGIVVHTLAFIFEENVTLSTNSFVVGHILLLAGFIVFALSSKTMQKLSKQIGFGE